MTLYYELSVAAHIFFGVCALTLMIAAVLVLVSACVLHLRCRYLILSSALLFEVIFVLQGIADVSLKEIKNLSFPFFSDIIGNLPYAAVILLLFFSAAAEVLFLAYIIRVKKSMLTPQYNLNKELVIRNKRLSSVNERLRRYSSEIEHVTAEKEILAAKIRVHDDVGRSLLAFRSYLAKPMSERDRNGLLFLWRYTISVMKKEAVTVAQSNDWELLLKAAEAVDVKIELRGELPEKGNIRAVITAAIHECLTNTVKHAKGNRLYMNIKSSDTSLTAEITNNGEQPKGEIKETGGLKNLRHIAESAGVAMTVESTPRFLLRLDFQKGDEI